MKLVSFLIHRKVRPMNQKTLREDATGTQWYMQAKACACQRAKSAKHSLFFIKILNSRTKTIQFKYIPAISKIICYTYLHKKVIGKGETMMKYKFILLISTSIIVGLTWMSMYLGGT